MEMLKGFDINLKDYENQKEIRVFTGKTNQVVVEITDREQHSINKFEMPDEYFIKLVNALSKAAEQLTEANKKEPMVLTTNEDK